MIIINNFVTVFLQTSVEPVFANVTNNKRIKVKCGECASKKNFDKSLTLQGQPGI